MDYKKKYEEALEKGREFYNRLGNKQLKEEVESIFPELVVSEDERIKQHLIDMLKNDEKCYLKELAWLEKQGEQKSAEWSNDYERYISYILTHCMHYAEEVGYVEEKNNSIIHQQAKDWLKALKERVQSQLKQEWKQENTDDLTDFEIVMMHIGDSFFGQHAGLDPNDTNAIKEQANILLELVPKQEWSKEDERIKNNLLSELTNLSVRKLIKKETEKKYVSWLKSLRPQSHWKPSNEQMDALAEALSLAKSCGDESAFDLRTLYEQLNKL